MAYENEKYIKNVIGTEALFIHEERVRQERMEELQEVYRKAKSFDDLVNFYPQKDEIPSDEFFMMMGYIIEGYKDELKEAHSKAKAFNEISKYVNKKLSAEVPLDDDYLIGRFESYETIQELMERADDER